MNVFKFLFLFCVFVGFYKISILNYKNENKGFELVV